MPAVQIRVNGKLVATCGAGALRQLVGMLAAQSSKAFSDSSVVRAAERGAVYSPDPGTDEVLRWVTNRIAFGDEVSLKYVDGAQGAAPGDPGGLPARPTSGD
jgi:hypothetical protein